MRCHDNVYLFPVNADEETVLSGLYSLDGRIFGEHPIALLTDVLDALVRVVVVAFLYDAGYLVSTHNFLPFKVEFG